MKYKKTKILLAFSFLGLGIQAQETTLASGSKASGIDGEINYSIGQIVYSTNKDTNASITQGTQQPFEISTLLGIEQISINLNVLVYPNPTTDFLTLDIENDFPDLSYILYDLQGKIIETKKIKSNSSRITTEKLSPSTYFLKVLKNRNTLKTFKIIKTNI